MTPHPKRKLSTMRQGQRRFFHAAKMANTSPCKNCGKPVLPHQTCRHCGFYKGKKITS